MDTIINKNRIRLNRGLLKNFYELPLEKQKVFLLIKEKICEFLGKDTKVSVFGSHYWGSWDEFSDYDILLEYQYYGFETDPRIEHIAIVKDFFIEKFDLKIDVLTMKGQEGILIP